MRPCSGSKKWCGFKPELDVLDQPVVDHQRAEQRRLRLDILRERRGRGRVGGLVDSEDFGHGGTLTIFGRATLQPTRDRDFGGGACGQVAHCGPMRIGNSRNSGLLAREGAG